MVGEAFLAVRVSENWSCLLDPGMPLGPMDALSQPSVVDVEHRFTIPVQTSAQQDEVIQAPALPKTTETCSEIAPAAPKMKPSL